MRVALSRSMTAACSHLTIANGHRVAVRRNVALHFPRAGGRPTMGAGRGEDAILAAPTTTVMSKGESAIMMRRRRESEAH